MFIGDTLVLIMDYVIEEGLPWASVERLLKLQNKLLGKDVPPESKYLFRKFANASSEDITFHFYCPTCESFLEKTTGNLQARQRISPTCSVCKKQYVGRDLMSSGSFFVGLPVETQLASVLSDEAIQEKLVESLASLNCDLCGNTETLSHVLVEWSNAHLFWDEMRTTFNLRDAFEVEWSALRPRSKRTIWKWVQHFGAVGSVANKKHVFASTPKKEQLAYGIMGAFEAGPYLSTKRAASLFGLSDYTVRRIRRRHNLHAYKVHVLTELKPEDYERRLDFCREEILSIAANPFHLDFLLFSDDAVFHLDGKVNAQNCRHWSNGNPHWTMEKSQYSFKYIPSLQAFQEATHLIRVREGTPNRDLYYIFDHWAS
ncbi:hypothetical protein HPB47_013465 [Ixodes persulcatus]|uniref:Uncharacterized protein n=1 Tax=Ixodes persulcatus TaxID=34615 RepID=A0AC60QYF9_IXOPE|nr:hypothetical protein HPB47_013465 [Ixodes persulcatus]